MPTKDIMITPETKMGGTLSQNWKVLCGVIVATAMAVIAHQQIIHRLDTLVSTSEMQTKKMELFVLKRNVEDLMALTIRTVNDLSTNKIDEDNFLIKSRDILNRQ